MLQQLLAQERQGHGGEGEITEGWEQARCAEISLLF